jgi:hypothetical protein
MPRIIADHNIEGHLEVLLRILQTGPWAEISSLEATRPPVSQF